MARRLRELGPLLASGTAAARLLSQIARLRRCEKSIDVAYGDGARHRLDVFHPRRADGAPVIVFFYGGRWESGDKAMYRFVAATLAVRGYVVVVPDYRLYPQVRFPEFLADAARALRWTRDNAASFGGDPARLFTMGHSAGAYIAAMLALDGQWLNAVGLEAESTVAGVIGLAGPYDFMPVRDPVLVDIFGGNDEPHTQPIAFAEGRKPPVLLLTGDTDRAVEAGNSRRLADRLRSHGNDATVLAYRRLGHLTIMAGLAPFLGPVFPHLAEVDAFVGRIAGARRAAGALP